MLDAHGQQAIGLNDAGLALLVQRAHMHGIEAFNAVVDAGHREATFFVEVLFGTGPDQFGVDEHQRLVAFLRNVDDHQALVHVHLGGGQANAMGVVHGGQHVGDQRPDAVVHRRNGACNLVKPGVRVTENGKDCHGSCQEMSLFSPLLRPAAAPPANNRCRIKGLSRESKKLCNVFARLRGCSVRRGASEGAFPNA